MMNPLTRETRRGPARRHLAGTEDGLGRRWPRAADAAVAPEMVAKQLGEVLIKIVRGGGGLQAYIEEWVSSQRGWKDRSAVGWRGGPSTDGELQVGWLNVFTRKEGREDGGGGEREQRLHSRSSSASPLHRSAEGWRRRVMV